MPLKNKDAANINDAVMKVVHEIRGGGGIVTTIRGDGGIINRPLRRGATSHGLDCTTSIPYRAASNARAERAVGLFQRGQPTTVE